MHNHALRFRIVSALLATGVGLLAGSSLEALALEQDREVEHRKLYSALHTPDLTRISGHDEAHAQAMWDYINTHS